MAEWQRLSAPVVTSFVENVTVDVVVPFDVLFAVWTLEESRQSISQRPAEDGVVSVWSSLLVVKKLNEKSFQVQAFCEERDLTLCLGVFWYAESKNQCLQTEKRLLIDLICLFSRWPPKTIDHAMY